MIGYRGCFRYVREPDLFRLELDVLAKVAAETPNLRLMIPFVRTAWELEQCLAIVADHSGAGRLPVWVMAEVPSIAYWIPTYARMGIEGVSIGSNDLTQLTLGVDRDSEVCAELFDEADPAVLDAIERIIKRLPRRRHQLIAVWPGTVEPAGVRGIPGPSRHHVDLGQPGCPRRRPPLDSRCRTALAAVSRGTEPKRQRDPDRLTPPRPTSRKLGGRDART